LGVDISEAGALIIDPIMVRTVNGAIDKVV
jgi:hypothetical protein